MNIEYRDIPNFPGYRVGDDGSVWTCLEPRRVGGGQYAAAHLSETWTRMRGSPNRHGYPAVVLRRDGKGFTKMVHLLVLIAFRGPCPDGMEACHGPDPTKTNCSLGNLRWDTHAANIDDRNKHGNTARGERNGRAKLTPENVARIKARLRAGETQASIAKDFAVSEVAVGHIHQGRRWRHVA